MVSSAPEIMHAFRKSPEKTPKLTLLPGAALVLDAAEAAAVDAEDFLRKNVNAVLSTTFVFIAPNQVTMP